MPAWTGSLVTAIPFEYASDVRKNCRVRTISNLSAFTSLSPSDAAFDGVTLTEGDRVLVMSQTAPAENGIYVVGQPINGLISLVRAPDCNTSETMTPALLTAVSEGSGANANVVYMLTTPAPITLGTTALTFAKYLVSNETITLSGDATGSGATAVSVTLTNTAVTPGTYGDGTHVSRVTIDSKGRVTGATAVAITGGLPVGAVTLTPAASTDNVIQPTGAAVIPLTVKGAAAQSANLTEFKNSAGTVKAAITKDGYLAVGDSTTYSAPASATYNMKIGGASLVALGLESTYAGGAVISIVADALDGSIGTSTNHPLTLGASVTQTVQIQPSGLVVVGDISATAAGTMHVQPAAAGDVGLLVKAHASQSGNLVQVKSNAGATLFALDKDGIIQLKTKTPASASDTGTAGQVAWDANYIYVCVATDTWTRAAISSW